MSAPVDAASTERARRKLERDYQVSWGFVIAGVGIIVISVLLIRLLPSSSDGVFRWTGAMAGLFILIGAIFVVINWTLIRRQRRMDRS